MPWHEHLTELGCRGGGEAGRKSLPEGRGLEIGNLMAEQERTVGVKSKRQDNQGHLRKGSGKQGDCCSCQGNRWLLGWIPEVAVRASRADGNKWVFWTDQRSGMSEKGEQEKWHQFWGSLRLSCRQEIQGGKLEMQTLKFRRKIQTRATDLGAQTTSYPSHTMFFHNFPLYEMLIQQIVTTSCQVPDTVLDTRFYLMQINENKQTKTTKKQFDLFYKKLTFMP